MPRAEVGSTKYIANKMKSKGLQRLRWYCQACQRQMRDENGFKCHVASEAHVRNMMLIGEDPRKAINEFSNQFKRDFLQLLRTGHGEKKVNLNHFYQEYIANKEHVHMNATKWPSLTEFAKYLGREGICRVEQDEKDDGRGGAGGLTVSWIDNSPEALRRQEALRKKERQDRGDEEREQALIRQQIERAKKDGIEEIEEGDTEEQDQEGIKRIDGEKIKLNFGAKKTSDIAKPPTPPSSDREGSADKSSPSESNAFKADTQDADQTDISVTAQQESRPTLAPKTSFKPMSISSSKPKNVFATASKKNALSGPRKSTVPEIKKPMSEAERIMKEEIERKRQREMNGGNAFKKQRIT